MTAEELWRDFCASEQIAPLTPYNSWAFGGDADNLAALVMLGVKTATASAYDLYAIEPDEPMPKEGDYSVVLDSHGAALCVIRTTKVYVEAFDCVSEEHAKKEGEGDRTLDYWRRVHKAFFMHECEDYGLSFSPEFHVLCEEFNCLYSLYHVADLTEEEARQACSWRYPGEYAVYDFPDWEECIRRNWSLVSAERRKNAYYSISYAGKYIAFFHIMDRKDHVELGIGTIPEQCGKHFGAMLMRLAMAKIEESYGSIMIQLSVRTFNRRAIRCYESVGFIGVRTCYEDNCASPGEMLIMQKKL